METIFASRFRTSPKLDYNRECLIMPDGGTVAVDFEPPSFDEVNVHLCLGSATFAGLIEFQ